MMDLKSPSKKRRSNHFCKTAPLPVLFDSGYCFDDYRSYGTFSGYFNGNSVLIDDPEEMKALYSMGFFGKGSLSKNYPNFGKHKKNEPVVLKEHQWARRKNWSNKLKEVIDSFNSNKLNEGEKNSASAREDTVDPEREKACSDQTSAEITNDDDASHSTSKDNIHNDPKSLIKEINITISEAQRLPKYVHDDDDKEVLVISDCQDVENLQTLRPHIETETFKTVLEVLYLTLEEAFFLSFALGCLDVLDLTGKPISLLQIWHLFNEAQSNFLENYVAYHYFRAKGWVVKSGLKFGGEFLLYKKGPAFYHASYIVLIENIRATVGTGTDEFGFAWNQMNTLNRMAETCNKEVVVCKIQWPTLKSGDKDNPLILKKFKVQEFLLRRWQPGQDKEVNE